MTILLTGGTGKTSSRIAPLLLAQGIAVILASRSGSAPAGFTGCRFDWLDETTYANPFEQASDITALYMVAPVAFDLLAAMKPFTEYAISKGVKRFVLLTSSTIEAGGHAHGKVHEYLVERGVDYGVLRPTWFMGRCTASPFTPATHFVQLPCNHPCIRYLPLFLANSQQSLSFPSSIILSFKPFSLNAS